MLIETKFKLIEKKEKKVTEFFNPFIGRGPKHYCIGGLYKDPDYEAQLYGLDRYLKSTYNHLKTLPTVSQDKPENFEALKQLSPLDPLKNFSSEGSSIFNLKDSLPKLKKLPHKDSKLSNLKDIDSPDKYKNEFKKEYRGLFSSTKIPIRKSPGKNNHINVTPDPKDSEKSFPAFNALDFERLKSQSSEKTSEINLFKKVQKEKTQIDPRECFLEYSYKEKPSPKFEMDFITDKKISKLKNPVNPERSYIRQYDIRYMDSPVLQFNNKCTASVTCISDTQYPKVVVQGSPGKKYDLSDTLVFKDWKNMIVHVQINYELFLDYYAYFGSFSEEKAQIIEGVIEKYLASMTPNLKDFLISPVVPLNLKKLSDKSPVKSKSAMKLPKSYQKPEKSNINYPNPITRGLISYRENVQSYNPIKFNSNLTIFEWEDYLSSKYHKVSKEKTQIRAKKPLKIRTKH
jgi:hypothetical protein